MPLPIGLTFRNCFYIDENNASCTVYTMEKITHYCTESGIVRVQLTALRQPGKTLTYDILQAERLGLVRRGPYSGYTTDYSLSPLGRPFMTKKVNMLYFLPVAVQ